MNSSPETCVVLLATHNGAAWLDEQLFSIFLQSDVSLKVIANDDASTDETRSILRRWAKDFDLEELGCSGDCCGSANRNFLKMICQADIGTASFVAFSDQDDVWLPDKLRRAMRLLRGSDAWGYSSNIEAFWADGTKRLIMKAHPQREFDHFFGSPGPGCTFLLAREAFLKLQAWVSEKHSDLQNLWVHDWIIYAFVRSHGARWIIDDYASMRYRQHSNNAFGANSGLSAHLKRLGSFLSGEYRRNVVKLCSLLHAPREMLASLERLGFLDRLWLFRHAFEFRRSRSEAFFLALLFLIMR